MAHNQRNRHPEKLCTLNGNLSEEEEYVTENTGKSNSSIQELLNEFKNRVGDTYDYSDYINLISEEEYEPSPKILSTNTQDSFVDDEVELTNEFIFQINESDNFETSLFSDTQSIDYFCNREKKIHLANNASSNESLNSETCYRNIYEEKLKSYNLQYKVDSSDSENEIEIHFKNYLYSVNERITRSKTLERKHLLWRKSMDKFEKERKARTKITQK